MHSLTWRCPVDTDIFPCWASPNSTGRPACIVHKAEIHLIFRLSRPWAQKHRLRAAIQRFMVDTISRWEPHRSSSQEQFVAMRPIVIDCSENSKHEYKKYRDKGVQGVRKACRVWARSAWIPSAPQLPQPAMQLLQERRPHSVNLSNSQELTQGRYTGFS